MSQHLFDAFEFFETKQWKQLIQYDLKGTSYEDLLHTSPEDITIKPFYNQDDLPKKDSEITVTNSWQIGHDIYVQHVHSLTAVVASSVIYRSNARSPRDDVGLGRVVPTRLALADFADELSPPAASEESVAKSKLGAE